MIAQLSATDNSLDIKNLEIGVHFFFQLLVCGMYWARWEIAATKNAIFFAVQLLLLAGALIASAAGVHSVLLHSTAPTPLKVSLCVARVGGRLVTFGAPLLLLTGTLFV